MLGCCGGGGGGGANVPAMRRQERLVNGRTGESFVEEAATEANLEYVPVRGCGASKEKGIPGRNRTAPAPAGAEWPAERVGEVRAPQGEVDEGRGVGDSSWRA